MNKEIEFSVKELHRIGELYTLKMALSNKLDKLVFEEREEREAQNSNFINDLISYEDEQVKTLPKIPQNNTIIKKPIPALPPNPKDPTLGAIVGIIYSVSLPLSIISFFISLLLSQLRIFNLFGVFAISLFAAIISGIAWNKHFEDIVSQYVSYKEELVYWENTANTSFVKGHDERFYSECMEFENAFLALAKVCDSYYEAGKEKNRIAVDNIQKTFSEKRCDLNNQLENTETQLNAVTLIHPDLFGNASHIAKLLEIGRADTLKEAINLALDENRKDAEEEARQLEAARQEAILEQQAEEARIHQQALEQATKEHNAAMEREAREHNLAMQAAAREQNDIAREQNRLVREQNRLAREQNDIAKKQNEVTSDDRHRCQKCKNRFRCSRNIHNCGAFVADF